MTNVGPVFRLPFAGAMKLSANLLQQASREELAEGLPIPDLRRLERAGSLLRDGDPRAEQRAARNRELREKSMDVQVHTVFRKEGRIVAVQWRDGGIEISDASAVHVWSRTRTQPATSELTREQTVDAYAAEFERNLGEGITVERYAGVADAPTRRDYEVGRLFTEADLRFGRKVNITA